MTSQKTTYQRAVEYVDSVSARNEGFGPLCVLITENKYAFFLSYIRNGYNVNTPQTIEGYTALQCSIFQKKDWATYALLAAGASVDMVPAPESQPPLSTAATIDNFSAFVLLLELGADASKSDYCGTSISSTLWDEKYRNAVSTL